MQIKLRFIRLYSFLEECYNTKLKYECQRFSPNQHPEFTDVEILTCYFWGILEDEKFKIKSIHSHIQKYWLSWFPNLPSYVAFNTRLNRMSSLLPSLLNIIIESFSSMELPQNDYLIDSMPIMLCKHKTGKIASEIANLTYSASKKMYYYGIKLHCLGQRRIGQLPVLRLCLWKNFCQFTYNFKFLTLNSHLLYEIINIA